MRLFLISIIDIVLFLNSSAMEVRLRNIIVLVSFILVITPYTIGINSLPIFGFGLEESPMYIMLFLKVDDSKERNDNFSLHYSYNEIFP